MAISLSPLTVGSSVEGSEITDATIGPADVSTAFQAAYGVDRGRAGLYAPQHPLASTSTLALIATVQYLGRFVPSVSRTVTKADFIVTTAAGSNDSMDFAILDNSLTVLASSGSTAGKLNSTGQKQVTFSSVSLTAGTPYYIDFAVGSFGGTAPSVLAALLAGDGGSVSMFGATAGNVDMAFNASSVPIGTGTKTISGATPAVPLVLLT